MKRRITARELSDPGAGTIALSLVALTLAFAVYFI
jgi:hypothetical protein